MTETQLVTLAVVGALLVIGAVSSISGRIGVAAPVVLVVAGVALGAIPGAARIEISPELILTIVLPPLLYAAARNVPLVDFRRNIRIIAFLSIAFVIVSAIAVGVVVHAVWPAVGVALAIALGAIVSPPDAVAATSLAKRIGLPPRIVTIIDGEGLINDATALVLLATALSIVTHGPGGIDPWMVALQFVWAVLGSTAIGVAFGWASVMLRQRVSNDVLDTTVALSIPLLCYLLAEFVGSSGIVAVVVAGIVVGTMAPFRIAAPHRLAEDNDWRLVSIVLENAVFLYMGLQLWHLTADAIGTPGDIAELVGLSFLIVAVLVALRFAVMPLLLWTIRRGARVRQRRWERSRGHPRGLLARRVDPDRLRESVENDLAVERDQPLGWRDGMILGMTGMRGVVTVAAAHTLPLGDNRSALILVAYAVAVITLLGQGLALPAVVRRLHPQADTAEPEERAEVAALQDVVQRAGDAEVERLLMGRDAPDAKVANAARAVTRDRAFRIREWAGGDPDDPRGDLRRFQAIRVRTLAAQRAALREERIRGGFSSDAIAQVVRTLDAEELELRVYGVQFD